MLTQFDLDKRKHERSDYLLEVATKLTAYSAGDVVGGIQSIGAEQGKTGPFEESWLSSILQSLAVIDFDNQGGQLDLFFFNQLPESTYTDGSAFAPSAADLANCVGVVNVASADYTAAGSSMKIAAGKNQANLGRVCKPFGSKKIYCVVVCRGTPTYGGELDIRLQFSSGI